MIEAQGHIRDARVIETWNSRVLILVKSDYPSTFEIFEPAVSTTAILKISFKSHLVPHFWEHDKKFYFAYEVERHDDSGLMDIEVHEAFGDKGPLATMSIPYGAFGIVERNGQTYLISQPRSLDSEGIQVYSLFNSTRE